MRLTNFGKSIVISFIFVLVLMVFVFVDNFTNSQTISPIHPSNNVNVDENIIADENIVADENTVVDESNDKIKQIKKTILFEPDLAIIKSEEYSKLDEFIEKARVLEEMSIQIEGNTATLLVDSETEFAKKLSLLRAKAVSEYLIYRGIEAKRIIIIGNGASNPIRDNNTEEGRVANRRVEVFFK